MFFVDYDIAYQIQSVKLPISVFITIPKRDSQINYDVIVHGERAGWFAVQVEGFRKLNEKISDQEYSDRFAESSVIEDFCKKFVPRNGIDIPEGIAFSFKPNKATVFKDILDECTRVMNDLIGELNSVI